MRSRITVLTTTLTLGLAMATMTPAWAIDPEMGRALHKQSCTACHGTEMYTRADRKIDSYPALQSRVARCTAPAAVQWNDEQKAAVVEYLDQEFYQFNR